MGECDKPSLNVVLDNFKGALATNQGLYLDRIDISVNHVNSLFMQEWELEDQVRGVRAPRVPPLQRGQRRGRATLRIGAETETGMDRRGC